MKQQWRKMVAVHPVVLFKDDISALVRLLTTCDPGQTAEVSAQFGYGGLEQTLDSVDELNEFLRSTPTNEFSMNVRIRDSSGSSIRSLALTMYRSYINYRISSEDEAWFLGRIAQLTRFFKARKPWYAVFRNPLLVAGPTVSLISCMLAISAFRRGHLFLAVSALGLSMALLVILVLTCTHRLFPYVAVHPYKKTTRRVSRELLSVVIAHTVIERRAQAIGSPNQWLERTDAAVSRRLQGKAASAAPRLPRRSATPLGVHRSNSQRN
jgi:hypothetical protein